MNELFPSPSGGPFGRRLKRAAGARIPVPVGAAAIVRTGGGGGWGDPCERDPAKVAEDVREELISREKARTLYGVVLCDDLTIDREATQVLRKEMQDR